MGTWVRGAWVRGCVGAWVRGCVGAWVREYVDGWVGDGLCVGWWLGGWEYHVVPRYVIAKE